MPTRNDVLQAAITVASIAVGIAVVLPLIGTAGPVIRYQDGSTQRTILVVPAMLLLCGFFALAAALRAIDEARRDDRLGWRDMIVGLPAHGLLFVALVLLTVVYIAVVLQLPTSTSGDT